MTERVFSINRTYLSWISEGNDDSTKLFWRDFWLFPPYYSNRDDAINKYGRICKFVTGLRSRYVDISHNHYSYSHTQLVRNYCDSLILSMIYTNTPSCCTLIYIVDVPEHIAWMKFRHGQAERYPHRRWTSHNEHEFILVRTTTYFVKVFRLFSSEFFFRELSFRRWIYFSFRTAFGSKAFCKLSVDFTGVHVYCIAPLRKLATFSWNTESVELSARCRKYNRKT